MIYRGNMNLKKYLVILAIVSTLSLTACSTVKISDYPQRQYNVPENVTTKDVLNNIKQAITQQARVGWVVEQFDSSKVIAGLTRRSHYLQVTYSINGQQVSSQITSSRNLDQKGNKIHKNAMSWKMRLDNSVFIQLSKSLN